MDLSQGGTRGASPLASAPPTRPALERGSGEFQAREEHALTLGARRFPCLQAERHACAEQVA